MTPPPPPLHITIPHVLLAADCDTLENGVAAGALQSLNCPLIPLMTSCRALLPHADTSCLSRPRRHADGTVKFWDASASKPSLPAPPPSPRPSFGTLSERLLLVSPPPTVMLQVLYKLKTAKVFDRNRSKDDKGGGEASDEDPFAIQLMAWCPESRVLSVAGVSADVIIYRFSKLEVTTEVVQVGSAKHAHHTAHTLAHCRVSMPTDRSANKLTASPPSQPAGKRRKWGGCDGSRCLLAAE